MSVFVVHPINDKSVDISAALQFGEPYYVGARYVYPDELEDDCLPVAVLQRILKATDRFDVESDYLLIAGDHLQLVAMSASLAERWGRFRVLRYDRQAKGYIVVNIEVNNVSD